MCRRLTGPATRRAARALLFHLDSKVGNRLWGGPAAPGDAHTLWVSRRPRDRVSAPSASGPSTPIAGHREGGAVAGRMPSRPRPLPTSTFARMFTTMTSPSVGPEAQVRAPRDARYDEILTPEPLGFIARLARAFQTLRRERLQPRAAPQAELNAGGSPDFLPETRGVREAAWTRAAIRPRLLHPRVAMTGPLDRQMTIQPP